ncbi:MAG: hypothetical protein E7Z90_07085 [Cyanobacteria bacterium SIG29]|nr:hypothetical protein [Cyanobacteria bacterium SIG29]
MKRLLGISFLIFLSSVQMAFAQTLTINLKDSIKSNQQTKVSTPITKEINNKQSTFTLNNALQTTFKTIQEQENIIYRESQKIIDAINPQKANDKITYYPGLRGPNQLIVYTRDYGIRTGTNEFGTEAIIENDMVVELNGADSIIPPNGFVISGHGSAKKWIMDNIQVGSKVYIDYNAGILRTFLTSDSLIYAAKKKLFEVNELVEYYKKIDILYNDKKATEFLEISKNHLRKAEKKPEKAQSYIHDAMESLNEAIKNAIPYYPNEVKGIWIRPTQTSADKIEKAVERIHKTGITDIFLETYFHGKTIYPSKYLEECKVISQREEFKDFDPLKIWIDEAHKRNMKVHIWFETFYVGNDNPKTTQNHILNIYPSWANKRHMHADEIDPMPSLSEHNGYFLDPANIQVQNFLLNIIKEITDNYKPDGINLDYIRYPQTVDPTFPNYTTMNWGYTKSARDEFKFIYGIDPINIKYGTGDWELWSNYRQNQISEFIKEVRKITKQKGLLLTTVVFPDLEKSKSTKMQNWRSWSMNNYVDGLTPLILTGDKNTANLLIKDVIKNTNKMTNIYPGIFVTFMGGPFDSLLMQIHKTREFKTKGAILFDYAHLSDEYIEALTTRVFNETYDKRNIKIEPNKNYKPVVTYKENKKKSRRKKK